MLQTLAVSLLTLGWEAAELGIAFQRFLLLLRRESFVATQPLPSVAAPSLGLLARLACLVPLFTALRAPVLSRAWQNCERQHKAGRRDCHFRRTGFQSEHCPRLSRLPALPTLRCLQKLSIAEPAEECLGGH